MEINNEARELFDQFKKQLKINSYKRQLKRTLQNKQFRKPHEYSPNDFFPKLPVTINAAEERTGAEEIDSTSENNSKLNKSSRTQPQSQDEQNVVDSSKQQESATNSSLNISKKSTKNSSKLLSSNKKKKNKVLNEVYHFIRNENENVEDAIEEYNEKRQSLQQRKSLCKRKLDYQDDVFSPVTNLNENTPPPSQGHSSVLNMSNSVNISKHSLRSKKDKSKIETSKVDDKSITPATLLTASNTSNLTNSGQKNKLHDHNLRNRSSSQNADLNEKSPAQPSSHTRADTLSINEIRDKSLMQPPLLPPPAPVSDSVVKSNSEIVITRTTKKDSESLNESTSKNKTLTIKILNNTSSNDTKTSKNRLVELKKNENHLLNDDSKDETELLQSQSRNFLRKSTFRQNNTTTSTVTSEHQRLSIASTRLSVNANPFVTNKNMETFEINESESQSAKKKRKRSPTKSQDKKQNTPSITTPNIENLSLRSQRLKNKKINHSYESDENFDDEDDQDFMMTNSNRRSKSFNRTSKSVMKEKDKSENKGTSIIKINKKKTKNKNDSKNQNSKSRIKNSILSESEGEVEVEKTQQKSINKSKKIDLKEDSIKTPNKTSKKVVADNNKKEDKTPAKSKKTKIPVRKSAKKVVVDAENEVQHKTSNDKNEDQVVEDDNEEQVFEPVVPTNVVTEGIHVVEPAAANEEEIQVIPETQEEPQNEHAEDVHENVVEPVNEVESNKKRKTKSKKKSKSETKQNKKSEAIVVPLTVEQEENDSGVRRSKRVKVQAHANLKPIYSLEYIDDFNGGKVPVRKIVGYEKMNTDLVRFREKFLKQQLGHKLKLPKINEDVETQKKTKENKKSKNNRIQRPASDDSENENEQEDEVKEVSNKKSKEKKSSKNKNKDKKRDKSVDDISIVYENDEDPIPVADINNNSNENNLNNNNEVETEQLPVENEPVTSKRLQMLLSQSYFNQIDTDKNLNHNNEVLVVEDDEKNLIEEDVVKFRDLCEKHEYTELSDGVLAFSFDKLGGIVCIEQTKATIVNEHDSKIIYFIQRGYVKLTMNKQTTILSVGDAIHIPKSNQYIIENPSKNQKAYLLFRFEHL